LNILFGNKCLVNCGNDLANMFCDKHKGLEFGIPSLCIHM
jgi:hypothetical protein